MNTCQHNSCEDSTDNTVMLENGETLYLCEDHLHMNPDGSPVDGYEPNDPSKFTYNNQIGFSETATDGD